LMAEIFFAGGGAALSCHLIDGADVASWRAAELGGVPAPSSAAARGQMKGAGRG